MRKNFVVLWLCFWLLPCTISADSFEAQATYSVCFTPGMNCTQQIVSAINNAVSDIWVQAYSFTSRPIGNALVAAKDRGVQVQIIFDKSILKTGKRNSAAFFARHGIPIWIDQQPAIAHNKVMILDQTKIITGSFNFTRAAQQQNAENVLIIEDAGLAKKYLQNWQQRKLLATGYALTAADKSVAPIPLVPQQTWFTQLWQWLLSWLKGLFSFYMRPTA